MDDDKQLMKYLSWLDDLDQEYIFHDVENISAVKMDQHDLTGQCSTNNTLQYDGNIANYDYASKMIPNYNVNETMMTEAISNAQPNTISDQYDYNFMQTENFYSNSIPQPHIPLKSDLENNTSSFCMDLTNAVHTDNDSYTNTSDPQLCIDITAGSNELHNPPEQSRYGLSNDVDIKENLFHEEKHVIDDNFTNDGLSNNSNSHNTSTTYTNEFPGMQHQNEMYCNQVPQEHMSLNDIPTNQNSFPTDTHSMNNVPNQPVIEPSIDIHDNFPETVKAESPEVKEEILREQPEIVSGSTTVPHSDVNVQHIIHTEGITQENIVKEENIDSDIKPTVNGVDKISMEDEIAHIQMCIRNGCANHAVNNPEWEQEFCSNDCVIIHCRNVFTAWVKANEVSSQ